MKANIILTTAPAIALLAGSGIAMASSLMPAADGVHVEGYDLSAFGIDPVSWTNFENDVKVKVIKKGKKGSKGTMLKVTGRKGSGHFFNIEPTDNLSIKGSVYKLTARFDTGGKLLIGKQSKVTINGTIRTEEGKVSGRLLAARLGDLLNGPGYALTDTLIGFKTHGLKCHAVIESISPGACEGGESAYVSLHKRLDDVTKKYKSAGLAVTGSAETKAVPVPAAAWLFGTGLLGLTGVGRRRKL
ncbi:MAG: VPLPA-CTERM sorting domain-containing protein [Pseudomonadota bacterium]